MNSRPIYMILTPANNEEEFLPKAIESVTRSSLTPILWLIVDDNSVDRTPNIIETASKKSSYIKILRLDEKGDRDLVFRYSHVCKSGFDYLVQLAQKNRMDWEYIVLLDADTVVERTYFEGVISRLQKDPRIGIASGDVYIYEDGKMRSARCFRDQPSGTARIWRKMCFYQTDGYCVTQTPDAVSTVKARLKGWKTVRFREYRAYQLRETSSAEGLWKGYLVRGKATYYVGCHPLLVLGRALSYMIQLRSYLVIAYFIGYLESLIKKEPKIQDKDVVQYYKKERLNELLRKCRKLHATIDQTE